MSDVHRRIEFAPQVSRSVMALSSSKRTITQSSLSDKYAFTSMIGGDDQAATPISGAVIINSASVWNLTWTWRRISLELTPRFLGETRVAPNSALSCSC